MKWDLCEDEPDKSCCESSSYVRLESGESCSSVTSGGDCTTTVLDSGVCLSSHFEANDLECLKAALKLDIDKSTALLKETSHRLEKDLNLLEGASGI